MISVCIASYNGSQWIDAQLLSILPQLGCDDEIVLVDDASTDNTLHKVELLDDPRIRMFSNARNLGVDQTFQKALSFARGKILFLSDQDDIWYAGKVDRVLQAFDEHPDVTLVLSDARIIDSEGRVISESYFGDRGKFIPGVFASIVKSKFLGCTIAVRSGMRDRFLPFPKKIPGHDMWIGSVNEYYGKTLFISDSLIAYRRHGKNASPEHRQNLMRMLIWRWQLAIGLVKRVMHLTFNKPSSRL